MNNLRYFHIAWWICFAFICGCSILNSKDDKIALVIGSEKISIVTLKDDLEFIFDGINIANSFKEEAFRKSLLKQIIDHYLILEYGNKNGIKLSENEFQAAMKVINNDYIEESAFREALIRGYVDQSQWQRRFRERLLVKKIIKIVTENIAPPEYDEIKEYYTTNHNLFTFPQTIKFRQIVTSTKKEAGDLKKQLQQKKNQMSKLAKKYSIAPEAREGGIVNWVAENNLEESMAKAVFNLPVGKISPVIKTPYGYHIFEVISIRPGGRIALHQILSEIKTKILDKRKQSFCNQWVNRLRKKITIHVYDDVLDSLEFCK